MVLSEAFNAEINVMVREFGVRRVSAELNKLAQTSDQISGRLKRAMSGTTGPIFEDMADAAAKMTVRFKMEWLSVMFFSMQVQRTLRGIFKGIISDFQKVAGSLHPINVQFNVLSATFTYLKYSIVEALSPLLEAIIPVLVEKLIALSEAISDNPERLAAFAIALGALFAVAGFTFFLAQFMLLLNSLQIFAIHNPGVIAGIYGLGAAFVSLIPYAALFGALYYAWNRFVKYLDESVSIFKGFYDFLFGAKDESWYMRIPLVRLIKHFINAIQQALEWMKTFLAKHAEFMAKLMTAFTLVNPLNLGKAITDSLMGGTYVQDTYNSWLKTFNGMKQEIAKPTEMTVNVKYVVQGELPPGLALVRDVLTNMPIVGSFINAVGAKS